MMTVQYMQRSLQSMKELGVRVSKKAIQAALNWDSIQEYYHNGASVKEVTDLLLDLY